MPPGSLGDPSPAGVAPLSKACYLPDYGFHIPGLGLAPQPSPNSSTQNSLGPVSTNRPLWPLACSPPLFLFWSSSQPPQAGTLGNVVRWLSCDPPPRFFLCCPSRPQPPCLCKNTLSRGPGAPTFIRSSAFTLLPWISSMQNGCSRDHRDIEEGWAAEGRAGRQSRGLWRPGGSRRWGGNAAGLWQGSGNCSQLHPLPDLPCR